MKNWRCRKTINMDEVLYDRINGLLPSGLQSKILGLVIENFFDSLPKENTYTHLSNFIAECLQKEADNGTVTTLTDELD